MGIIALSQSSAAHNFETLDFHSCTRLTPNGLAELLASCHSLRKFVVGGCVGMDSTALHHLLDNCNGTLEVLNLRGCREIASVDLEAIGVCNKLQSLDIARLSVDRNFFTSLSSCGNLTKIDLSGCSLNSSSFPQLALFPSLRSITADANFELNEEAIESFISLSLDRCMYFLLLKFPMCVCVYVFLFGCCRSLGIPVHVTTVALTLSVLHSYHRWRSAPTGSHLLPCVSKAHNPFV